MNEFGNVNLNGELVVYDIIKENGQPIDEIFATKLEISRKKFNS